MLETCFQMEAYDIRCAPTVLVSLQPIKLLTLTRVTNERVVLIIGSVCFRLEGTHKESPRDQPPSARGNVS